jgi:hypothetical protein
MLSEHGLDVGEEAFGEVLAGLLVGAGRELVELVGTGSRWKACSASPQASRAVGPRTRVRTTLTSPPRERGGFSRLAL